METSVSRTARADVATHAERWLADAYRLVSSGWCQDHAQDEAGSAIAPASPYARRWSPTGALQRLLEQSSLDAATALAVYQRAHLALVEAVDDLPAVWNAMPGRTQQQAAEAVLTAVSLVRFAPRDEADEDAAGRSGPSYGVPPGRTA